MWFMLFFLSFCLDTSTGKKQEKEDVFTETIKSGELSDYYFIQVTSYHIKII